MTKFTWRPGHNQAQYGLWPDHPRLNRVGLVVYDAEDKWYAYFERGPKDRTFLGIFPTQADAMQMVETIVKMHQVHV